MIRICIIKKRNSMAVKRHNFQFRLAADMEELILAEAARRNVSPSDYARSLVISSLRDTSHLSARSDMSLKLQATATFQLTHFIFELMKKLDPDGSDTEITEYLNRAIFTPAKQKAEAILEQLGTGENHAK
ncbi:hypothetical protein C1N60_23300 (plasmid) [Pantoea sp. SGAir0184]